MKLKKSRNDIPKIEETLLAPSTDSHKVSGDEVKSKIVEEKKERIENLRKRLEIQRKVGQDNIPFAWKTPLKIESKQIKMSKLFKVYLEQEGERDSLPALTSNITE